jgi:hypothetical protein
MGILTAIATELNITASSYFDAITIYINFSSSVQNANVTRIKEDMPEGNLKGVNTQPGHSH